jgi:SAM-dependent methyltransferase
MKENKTDYISIIYSESRTPKSTYPMELIRYLMNRYSIENKGKILEIGCGRGDFLCEFSKVGLTSFGVDRESSAIEFTKELDIQICDISKDKLPFCDNYFDVIFHKSLIEHLYDPENLMRESFRTLKQSGRIIILTPDWVSQMKIFYEDITHSRPYDKSALRDALSIYGFRNISVEKFYQLPILWKHKFLKIFSILLRMFFSVNIARSMTKITKIKYFRWSVELMILGYGEK